MLFEWFNRTKVSHSLTLIGWFVAELRSTFEIKSSKPYYILKSFLTRNTVNSLANICGMDSLSSPRQSFVLSCFKICDWLLSPQKGGKGWYCVGFFSIYFTHLRLPILKLILHSHNKSCKSHGLRLCKSLKATYTFSHKI